MGFQRWNGLKRMVAANRVLAAVLVTVLTLLLIGGVVATTTSLACGPVNQLKLKLARCADANNVAALQSPTAKSQSPTPTPSAYPTASVLPSDYPQVSTLPTDPPLPIPPAPMPASAAWGQNPFYPGGSQMPFATGLNCSLPVYVGPAGSGGFLTMPGYRFVADPRSAVALPSPPVAPSPPPGPGYAQPTFGMAYDRAHSRWLPVNPSLVAPDGSHYAYPSSDAIYLVTVSTNTQVELGQGHAWSVLRVLNDRVFATIPNTPGFWVVPFSGTPQQLATAGYWQAASAVAAYGTATSAVPQGTTQKLLKLDIATGRATDWFSDGGASVVVLGFDRSGNPVIQANYGNGWAIALITSATSVVAITDSTQGLYSQGAAAADSHGIWFSFYSQSANSQGLALFVRGSGLYWMANLGAQLAGGCD